MWYFFPKRYHYMVKKFKSYTKMLQKAKSSFLFNYSSYTYDFDS